MAPAMTAKEITLQHNERLPKGYCFVRKGNAYISRHVKKETIALGKSVYITLDRNQTRSGLAVPFAVAEKVRGLEASTRTDREAAVAAKDQRDLANARECLSTLFPRFPANKVDIMLQHAFKKSSRRVGRVGTLDLEDKIDMAVAAHARHKCTNYDLLLTNQGVKKSLARRIVLSDVQAVLTTWRGEKWQPRHVAECAVLRSHVRRDKSAAMKHETVLRCSAARRAVPDKGPIQRKAKKVRRRTQEIQAARRRLVTPGKEPNVIEQDDSDVEVPNLTKNRVELENDFLDEPNLAPKLGSDEEFVPSDDDLGSVSSSPPTRRRSLRLSIASSSALITKKTASNTTRGLLKRNEMVKGRVTETVRPGSQMLSASTSFGSGNSNDVFIFISDDDENTLDKSKQASTINLATVSNAHLPPPKTRLVGGEEKRSSSVKRPPKSERKKLKKKRRAERKLLRRVQKAEIELKNELANPKREARRQRQGQPS